MTFLTQIGNSNAIARAYLDALRIETRYINATNPTTEFELYGERFASPIMTAALSHLDHDGTFSNAVALAEGAREANCALWYGMAPDAEIEALAATGARLIEIIKPYADRKELYRKLRHAEKLGALAVGIDIDHPFAGDGSPDICDGWEMRAMTTEELSEFCASTKLPVIVKGVLSRYDAEQAMKAGVQGMVLSHHNDRIEYALPPVQILPEIVRVTGGSIPLFVDCMVQTGMDAFKALALGAKGVCIGRPLIAAIAQDPVNGVKEYLNRARDELAKAMAFTGTADLGHMDPTVVHLP